MMKRGCVSAQASKTQRLPLRPRRDDENLGCLGRGVPPDDALAEVVIRGICTDVSVKLGRGPPKIARQTDNRTVHIEIGEAERVGRHRTDLPNDPELCRTPARPTRKHRDQCTHARVGLGDGSASPSANAAPHLGAARLRNDRADRTLPISSTQAGT